ncbi:MAG: hypothetical protein ACYDHE_21120 [Candidatus Acidiferrales bacterium]
MNGFGEIDELYQSKDLRNARYRELKAQGKHVEYYSVRGQRLHPMYVEDLKDTPEGRDTGFGNTVYQALFPVLYGVRERRSQSSRS